MSLFPAYSNNSSELNSAENENAAGPSWLSNSTFSKHNLVKSIAKNSSSSEDSRYADTNNKTSLADKKRKTHKKSRKIRKKQKGSVEGLYYEDMVPMPAEGHRNVPKIQLTKPVPNSKAASDQKKKKKKKKRPVNKKRYFKGLNEEREMEMDTVNPKPMDIEEFLKQTETFNKNLRNEPHNIRMWLDYVNLQDFGDGSTRGRGEKKLSILDKALEENPESDELLHQKMLITETLYPMEKIANEAKAIVTKYPKNLVGWLWVLNSSQYNLSKMTAPGVLLTYEQVLGGINKAYHDSKPLLDFLLLCGLFLRQCGLWEQLCVLLELYLELNLTTAGSEEFKVDVTLPDEEIQQTEDGIITSGLPLGALWLRVERLRECVYFSAVEESPDPQRVVFKEDMSPLLYPITRTMTPQLIIYTLLLLKVPPLPLSQAFFRYSGLQNIPWHLDTVELILAAKFSRGENSYLDIASELLLGPQYISNNLGRSEYFNFVNSIFDKCIAHCESNNRCFLVWQMRWWRWIYGFHKLNDSLNLSSKKNYLSLAKKALKQNRDLIALYTEYALLENEAGDFDAAIKVFETTMSLRDPPLLTGIIYKRDLCHLYRVYVDLLIRKDEEMYKEKVLSTLIALAFGEHSKNIKLRDELIIKCNERFKHITTEIVRDFSDHSLDFSDIIFPEFSVSWLICHAWFLYLTKGVWESVSLLGNAIKELNNLADMHEGNMLDLIQEGLHEGLLEIFSYYSQGHPGNNNKLYDLAGKAVKCYPNNAFFLNTVYSCEPSGLKWSNFLSDIKSFDSSLPSAIVYFMTHARYTKEESLKTVAGSRLQHILERLTNQFERCPLFWRILLQASGLKDVAHIKRTFYLSLEKCPWVKILYYEAAKILPEDLPEIQDLLVEKELRLHITPEELEILREGD